MIVALATGLLGVAVALGWLLLREKARVEELQGQLALKENWAVQLEERCLGLENEKRLLMAQLEESKADRQRLTEHLNEAKSQEYVGPPRTQIRRIPQERSLGDPRTEAEVTEQVEHIDQELAKRGIS